MNEQWDVKIVEEGMKNGRRRLRRDEEGRGQVNGGWRTVGGNEWRLDEEEDDRS